jgi:cobalt/nickel transport system permease protein
LHHVIVDRWSRGDSYLHARDPRAKIIALLVFLIVLATTPGNAFLALSIDLGLLLAGIAIARLPLFSLLLRACSVLPFSFTFALISWLAGDRPRALALLEKTYLSAVAVLLLAGSTPLPSLVRGIELLRAPRLLLTVVQFLYRYLFVISEQAQHMRLAALSRSGLGKRGRSRFRAAAGAVAVLFARSYYRSDGIHRAMLARGFQGHFPISRPLVFRLADAAFTLVFCSVLILTRMR